MEWLVNLMVPKSRGRQDQALLEIYVSPDVIGFLIQFLRKFFCIVNNNHHVIAVTYCTISLV